MSKRPKRLTRRERRAEDEALPRILVFDKEGIPFRGTIEEYIDRIAQRFAAEAEWDELIEALRNDAGRLAFHRSREGLVFGLEIGTAHNASYRGFRAHWNCPCELREAA